MKIDMRGFGWNKPLSEAPVWFQRLVLRTELVLFIAILIGLILL